MCWYNQQVALGVCSRGYAVFGRSTVKVVGMSGSQDDFPLKLKVCVCSSQRWLAVSRLQSNLQRWQEHQYCQEHEVLELVGHLLLILLCWCRDLQFCVTSWLSSRGLSLFGVLPVMAKRGSCRMKAKIHVPAVRSDCNWRLVSLMVSSYFSFFLALGSSSRHRLNFLRYIKYSVHWGTIN